MSCIVKRDVHVCGQRNRAVIPHGDVLFERIERVLGIVQRLDRRQTFLRILLADVFGVLHLNVRAVEQHHVRKVARGACRVDGSREAHARKHGDFSRVVDMRMRKHDDIDGCRIERERAVFFVRFGAASLEQTAIEKDSFAAHFQNMRGTRDRLRGAVKCKCCHNATVTLRRIETGMPCFAVKRRRLASLRQS